MRIDAHHGFSERYPLDHLESILKRNRFEGGVLVTGAPWPDAEFVKAVVVHAGALDSVPFEDYQRRPKFRGVCCGLSEVPAVLAELEDRDLTLDLIGGLSLVPRIADRFPRLRIALDHAGEPLPSEWETAMERVAQYPQVSIKLSGLMNLMPSPRPYVQHALAVFGPRRVMFGSDWPHSLPEHSWKANLAAFTQAIGAQPIEVREELLGGTAARFYAL